MKLSEILVQDAEGMYRATEGLFKMVDDLEWKPASGANWMSTGQLLKHCTHACGKTMKGFITGDWGLPEDYSEDAPPENTLPAAENMPAVESVDEALRLLAEDRALCMTLLTEVDDERLTGERSAAPWGGPERTLFQHLNEMVWHLGQHKGQLFYYLKLQGKPVNTMHLWMGSA
ncbi:MAG: DinB family protein [Gemmatimonadota bacterium]